MEALQAVKAELQRAHAPVVMTIAAPAAEAACAKNGLSFAELLRPFGSVALRELNGTVGGEPCDRSGKGDAAVELLYLPASGGGGGSSGVRRVGSVVRPAH